jgi:hypothetical protein
MSQSKAKDSATDGKETSASSDENAEILAIQKSMEGIRGLLQTAGTAIGTAATVVLAGLGYAQLHQIFPLPTALNVWWFWAVVALVAIGTLSSAFWLAAIFLKAQRRILLTTDPYQCDVSGGGFGRGLIGRLPHSRISERQLVETRYSEAASEENAPRFRDLELRANRLRRMSLRPGIATADQRLMTNEYKRIDAMIDLNLYRVALELLERRSAIAFKGGMTAIAFVCAAAGIVALFGLSDYSKGQRDLITMTKDCASLPASSARLGWCQTLDVPRAGATNS